MKRADDFSKTRYRLGKRRARIGGIVTPMPCHCANALPSDTIPRGQRGSERSTTYRDERSANF
jgi:hypothetical protein